MQLHNIREIEHNKLIDGFHQNSLHTETPYL